METLKQDEKVDVLIQGAGIGGLTLALALLQRGISAKIVEKSKDLSAVGAGIWMAPNAMQVYKTLRVSDAIIASGWPIRKVRLQDYRGFDLQVSDISEIAKIFGFETLAIHRASLQRCLFDQLPAGTIIFEAEIQDLQETETDAVATLTNGTTIMAKAIVGADGINSRMRQRLNLAGEKRYSGSSSYRGIAKDTALSHFPEHEASEIWAKGCRLGFSKINAHDYYWYMTFDSPAGVTLNSAEIHAHACSLFDAYFPKWKALLESTLPQQIIRTDIADLKPLPKWCHGRVGLIGDAAHATTPNLGQGGGMAVEDAYALAKIFAEAGLDKRAFIAFEQMRRSRVSWIVSTSWSIGKICHLRNPLLRGFRNALIKYTPPSFTKKQWSRLYSIAEL